MALKLELGAGDRPTPGFVHTDLRKLDDIEHICDARYPLEFFGKESASQIRATHLLEHFSHRETVNVLKNWYETLEPGGMLYIEVPNFLAQAKALVSGEIDSFEAARLAYGDQDYEGNEHRNGFTEISLTDVLSQAGFVKIETRDIGMVILAVGFKE